MAIAKKIQRIYHDRMSDSSPTACLIIIGNEILSGRTQDTNLAWLGKELNEIGVRLREARVIPDIETTIIATVNECRTAYDYVFTTGGIGPTHDDITSAAIARAFGVPLHRDTEAQARLTRHYGVEQLTEARLKMADVPEGAELIDNPVSAAPGFRMENVFVMAGVPRIMQAMFGFIKAGLRRGEKIHSRTVAVNLPEGLIAAMLSALQNANPDVEIGSYPYIRGGQLGTSLVLRCVDIARLKTTGDALRAELAALGGATEEE